MRRYICIHGHFYQPPRENPWLEEVEIQDSAYPFHDWNDKITAECYAPNINAQILDSKGDTTEVSNNYNRISFNFGPTLLSWMERNRPEVYRKIIETEMESRQRFSGHGPAIAQVYNHVIMPLASEKDKHSQIIWGIKDFEYRFGRKPEGMWLSETAVDTETLDVLVEHGIKFTILAPHQARRVRKIGDRNWKNVRGGKIDPKTPYLYQLPSGRNIILFFYDGGISHDIAFGDLLKNGENFANRLFNAFSVDKDEAQIVHIATDGETYGHHHRFGDMALAFCLNYIEACNLAQITVFGEYLERYPPTHEVEITENTAWSCFHGVERWRSDCGCNSGRYPKWNQKWRGPMREAMDWLRDTLSTIYEKEMADLVKDPWQARNDYIKVILDRSVQNVEIFFSEHAIRKFSKEQKIKVLKLLEMQRNAMLMYASDGWYFDEISGIEAVQNMQYASRAMQIANEVSGVNLEPDYLKILETAPSNIPEYKNGAQVHRMFVKPLITDLLRVGAHYALSSIFRNYQENEKIYCYTANSEIYEKLEAENQKLAVGRTRLRSDITWEESVSSFAVLKLENHNFIGRVSVHMSKATFSIMHREIKDVFLRRDISKVIHLMDKHFGTYNYSLLHLFKNDQRKILSTNT
jgi:alpha-amylase/alpha-mannosidase (GH57 family)